MKVDADKIQSILDGKYSSLDEVLCAVEFLSEIFSTLNEKVIPYSRREAFEAGRKDIKLVNPAQFKKVNKAFGKVRTKLSEMEDAVFLMEKAKGCSAKVKYKKYKPETE